MHKDKNRETAPVTDTPEDAAEPATVPVFCVERSDDFGRTWTLLLGPGKAHFKKVVTDPDTGEVSVTFEERHPTESDAMRYEQTYRTGLKPDTWTRIRRVPVPEGG